MACPSLVELLGRQLQKEKRLRAEAERRELEAIQIGEALFQRLDDARTVTDKLSAESQMERGKRSRKLLLETSLSLLRCSIKK